MKKTIGYGYKLTKESFKVVLDDIYSLDTTMLNKTKRQLLKELNNDKYYAYSKNAKPQLFKVTVELINK